MKHTIVILFLSLFIQRDSYSQDIEEDLYEIDQRKNITNESGSIIFYTTKEPFFSSLIDTAKEYYWYSNHNIHHSYGAIGGQALNGKYVHYYRAGSLAESGSFAHGLKVGAWVKWHTNGRIKEIINWKSGIKSGNFSIFHPSGAILLKGCYRNGRLNGKVHYSIIDTQTKTLKFRNGFSTTPIDTILKLKIDSFLNNL
jgi:antitoxin component YwqK of YwqJK toxin-antitoxin module